MKRRKIVLRPSEGRWTEAQVSDDQFDGLLANVVVQQHVARQPPLRKTHADVVRTVRVTHTAKIHQYFAQKCGK